MKKILAVVVVLLLAVMGWLVYSLMQEKQANKDMQELAELDKQEMENEYQSFAAQYSEMKTYIRNDSIIAELTAEQERTQKLLEELKRTHASDAAEITRLKKELATVRAVLRSYVLQIDSLNRLNQSLQDENNRISTELAQSNQHNQELATQKATLTEKVAIAAQLDATGIQLTPVASNGKAARKWSKVKKLMVSFLVTKNVTASNGVRTFYVRITTPEGEVLGGGGTFTYAGKQLACSMKKDMEYSGEELSMTLYRDVEETLSNGQYNVSIFCDGQAIGSRNIAINY